MKHILTIILISVLTMLLPGAEILAQRAYKFAEPKDNVAKEIWNILKKDDQCIREILADAQKIDKAKYDSAEHFISKTAMEFDFRIPYSDAYSFLHDDSIATKFQLQCYQMKNGTWLAVLNTYTHNICIHNVSIMMDDCDGIKVMRYEGGQKLSYLKMNSIFPEDFIDVEEYAYLAKCVFSDTEINCYGSEFGPIKLVWNGKRFVNSSKILYNVVEYNGGFRKATAFASYPIVQKNIGDEWYSAHDGIIMMDKDKQKVVQFDIKDGIIEGYTILSPSCGFAMERLDEDGCLQSNPVTIGSPMQYVLNHLDTATATKTTQNGKLVVTQLIDHDTRYKKRDVFVEITAKDENSPVEAIKVSSTPLTITFQGVVFDESEMSDDAKTILKALNLNEKDYGEFKGVSISFTNGVEMDFATPDFHGYRIFDSNLTITYFIYDANGKYLVVLSKAFNYSNDGDKFWFYENGTLTPTDITIPAASFNQPGYSTDHFFNSHGFCYYHINTETHKDVFEYFVWDGEKFVKK